MNDEVVNIRPCYVLLEQCTPKAQLALSAELRNVINERNILTSKSKEKFLSALDEINSTDIETRRKKRKHQAVQEILSSEMAYLKQLEIIMNFFMKPIQSKGIIGQEQFEILFGSIDNLYKVNGELLNELKNDLMSVSAAFFKLAPFFKMYSVYAYDYKNCLDTLKNLYETNKKFTGFLLNQESRPEVQSKLSSLLITPIQRIPRYCMLLKQVLDNTNCSEPDYDILKDSLKKLEAVARHINTLVEERENSQRLLELLRCMKNGKELVIQPGRKLIKEGILVQTIPKRNNTEKVYLVLMSDIIMLCHIRKTNLCMPNSLKCHSIYPLNKCKVTQNTKTKMFEITCHDESVVLHHQKVQDTDEWIDVINSSILKCIRNRNTLRKGSSSRRPAGKDNLRPYMDVGVSPGVSRIRKRRRTEENVEREDGKMIRYDDSCDGVNCLPIKLSCRKSIHKDGSDCEDRKDSLFPLRHHFSKEIDVVGVDEPDKETPEVDPSVFVFGNENVNSNRGFSFRLNSIFSGIKRAFGFKSDQ
ncbi:PREDICTED: putative protein tag-52 [Nicrophorus vespilloides]|uniref:Rho guanine nucleotide exchange factor n=1 Tax=Nicrophorus vespilloides TaxID=110193 RepID=A0ABM1MKC8_NICVS|nr:PREDICTED: putative protein tag-52 [Nicrophorus vespilloides]